MKHIAILLVVALTGCSTTAMMTKSPDASYPSQRSREVVSGCLLDRLLGELRPGRIERGADASVVKFTSLAGNPTLIFTVRDQGSGSVTEMRRLTRMSAGRRAAETCF